MNVFSTVGVVLAVLAYYGVGAGWWAALAWMLIGILIRAVFVGGKQ